MLASLSQRMNAYTGAGDSDLTMDCTISFPNPLPRHSGAIIQARSIPYCVAVVVTRPTGSRFRTGHSAIAKSRFLRGSRATEFIHCSCSRLVTRLCPMVDSIDPGSLRQSNSKSKSSHQSTERNRKGSCKPSEYASLLRILLPSCGCDSFISVSPRQGQKSTTAATNSEYNAAIIKRYRRIPFLIHHGSLISPPPLLAPFRATDLRRAAAPPPATTPTPHTSNFRKPVSPFRSPTRNG